MNTNPDETKLALWLDDELTGKELAEMDAWAAHQPEQLAAREELRAFRRMISENLPASEEPPYPDFFQSRIHQGIREIQARDHAAALAPVADGARGSFWRSWLLPAAACAGMVLAFGIGKQTREVGRTAAAPPAEPMVYTPEEGVNAEWFSSSKAGASVIVLQGISAIPDSMDFSETVYVPMEREADRTAGQPNGRPSAE
jgi:hypothetical protein